MFLIDKIKSQELGDILKSLRNKKKYTLRDISELTGIVTTTISRLEEGNTKRVNVQVLNSLASAYNINPLIFLKIIDYIKEEDIENYAKNKNSEIESIKNHEIEILNENSKSYFPKKFLSFSNMPDVQGIEIKEFIFLYSNKKIENEDLVLLNNKNEIVVGNYNSLKDIISLKNFFTGKIEMFYKNKISILGKVEVFINLSANKK